MDHISEAKKPFEKHKGKSADEVKETDSLTTESKAVNSNQSKTKNPIALRLATIDDVPYLSHGAMKLAQQEIVGSKLQLSNTLQDELTRYYRSAIEDPTMLLLIAEDNVSLEHKSDSACVSMGFLVGAIHPSPNAYTTLCQFASIHTVWIEPTHRKQGVASWLVKAFESTVVEHGIDIVDVAHVASNVSAEAFWQQLGYDAVSIIRRKKVP